MSIDFNWETLTTGPDGQELAHRIRDFIHSKFQSVPLPRFIKSVTVHDFEFGSIGPELELKDITDPLPDFYEEDEEDEDEEGEGSDNSGDSHPQDEYDQRGPPRRRTPERRGQQQGDQAQEPGQGQGHRHGLSSSSHQTVTGMGPGTGAGHHGPPGTRGGVPGGTSNLLHHFHNHLAPTGWSGTQTPLAAMAGAHLGGAGAGGGYFQEQLQSHGLQGLQGLPGLQGLQGLQGLHGYHGSRRSPSPSHSRNPSQGSSISIDNYRESLRLTPATAAAAMSSSPPKPTLLRPALHEKHSVSTLAPTSAGGASRPPTRDGRDGSRGGDKLTGMAPTGATAQQILAGSAIEDHDDSSQEQGDDGDMDRTLLLGQADGSGPGGPGGGGRRFREPRAEDMQAVFRIKYAGDVKLLLTADILLDYPMPSFVGIPVRLSITGLTFDGVGVLANIRKRLHFCFLSPEDALAAVGDDNDDDEDGEAGQTPGERGIHDNDDGGFGPGRRPAALSTVPPLPPYSSTNLPPPPPPRTKTRMGGLLQEVRVESEIGQREGGKQSLKNVGKVERFVLEQVRRIFEEEFVYPSFWTFLV
ncbi:mitochondrial inheritance component mdm12 [Ophiostoma piceae UAMH 11346]|uniref:Mitochondrial distribution and morphology protein 12 n=1 Tax=Ophiostoma piceae (strain UAMH 11346) TaxID=1262450 RepID=S3BQ27_OPHP1|nr:mitochondrial inheritance component mdm12 [Ophiostoma piceae UAMH 11346]